MPLRCLVPLLCGLLLTGACASAPTASTTPEPSIATAPSDGAPAETAPSAELAPKTELDADVGAVLTDFMVELRTELPLSERQLEPVQRILEHHAARMQPHLQAIMGQTSRMAKMRAAQERRPQLQKIRDTTDQQMRDLLDEQQYARYLALRESFREELRATMQQRYG